MSIKLEPVITLWSPFSNEANVINTQTIDRGVLYIGVNTRLMDEESNKGQH